MYTSQMKSLPCVEYIATTYILISGSFSYCDVMYTLNIQSKTRFLIVNVLTV